jgi:uncharacterized protein (TIGR00255 family)
MAQIKSMTGTGSGSAQGSGFAVSVQLRSVNSRFLDFKFSADEGSLFLESKLRGMLKGKVERGRVECACRIAQKSGEISIDRDRLEAVMKAVAEVRKIDPSASASATEVLSFPGVASSCTPDEKELEEAFSKAFAEALEGLVRTRAEEGGRLAAALNDRLDKISALLDKVEGMTDSLTASMRTALQKRVSELFSEQLDPGRLEQEVLAASMRADIQEEYDRLRSHVASARAILKQGGLCGKKLDFLMQEFNREANTMSSKSCSLELTQICVDLKVFIEQMREQVQNIE